MSPTELIVFWIAVTAYMALVIGIGLWSYGRASKEEGFLVAGRSLGPVIGGATLMANQVSAGATKAAWRAQCPRRSSSSPTP